MSSAPFLTLQKVFDNLAGHSMLNAQLFSDAVTSYDYEKVRALMQKRIDPNTPVLIEPAIWGQGSPKPGFQKPETLTSWHLDAQTHPLKYLFETLEFSDSSADGPIIETVKVLLEKPSYRHISDIAYEADYHGLTAADHAALCFYSELGSAIFMDKTLQIGLQRQKNPSLPLFVPKYDRLLLLRNPEHMADFHDRACRTMDAFIRRCDEFLKDCHDEILIQEQHSHIFFQAGEDAANSWQDEFERLVPYVEDVAEHFVSDGRWHIDLGFEAAEKLYPQVDEEVKKNASRIHGNRSLGIQVARAMRELTPLK